MKKKKKTIEQKTIEKIQHFNYEKYWRMRDYLQSLKGKKTLKAIIYMVKVKRMEAFSNSSSGISFGSNSAIFESHPRLPHGLCGIFITPGAHIGKNVRICQQVTIGNDFKDTNNCPNIGDDVEIYPGAKIIGKINIGKGAKIGANAVVNFDVPEGSVVVVEKARMLTSSKKEI